MAAPITEYANRSTSSPGSSNPRISSISADMSSFLSARFSSWRSWRRLATKDSSALQRSTLFHILLHGPGRQRSPCQELLAQFRQKRSIHPIPAPIISTEPLQVHVHFKDFRIPARFDGQIHLLPHAKVKRRQPDQRVDPARGAAVGCKSLDFVGRE